MFSIAPLKSLSAMMTPVDPDPVASFRELIALPPGTTREAPRIDPRRIRTIVDRGVVEYASAKTDGDRARGARLIQTAALVGYPPARDLLARNYPQSEAVRSVVPAKDVIRYALGPVMDGWQQAKIRSKYSSRSGNISPFRDSWICSPPRSSIHCAATCARSSVIGSTPYWTCWRACPEPVVRSPALLPGAGEVADQECFFSENLRKYIETTRPSAAEEEESKHRGLLMLNQLGER